MQGYITGGWEYVAAAYGFTGTLLTSYLISVILRLRAESRAQKAAELDRHESEDAHASVPAAGMVS